MDSREQFEKWYASSWSEAGGEPTNSFNKDDTGQYTDTYVNEFWTVWQASRASASTGHQEKAEGCADKPDWKYAPEWASALLVQPGFCGPCYCWAEAYKDGAIAIWHDDLARSWMAFELRKANWTYVEARP